MPHLWMLGIKPVHAGQVLFQLNYSSRLPASFYDDFMRLFNLDHDGSKMYLDISPAV